MCSSFALIAFSGGKPVSTFPENALPTVVSSAQESRAIHVPKKDQREEFDVSHVRRRGRTRGTPASTGSGARRGVAAARRQAVRRRLHAIHGHGRPEDDR